MACRYSWHDLECVKISHALAVGSYRQVMQAILFYIDLVSSGASAFICLIIYLVIHFYLRWYPPAKNVLVIIGVFFLGNLTYLGYLIWPVEAMLAGLYVYQAMLVLIGPLMWKFSRAVVLTRSETVFTKSFILLVLLSLTAMALPFYSIVNPRLFDDYDGMPVWVGYYNLSFIAVVLAVNAVSLIKTRGFIKDHSIGRLGAADRIWLTRLWMITCIVVARIAVEVFITGVLDAESLLLNAIYSLFDLCVFGGGVLFVTVDYISAKHVRHAIPGDSSAFDRDQQKLSHAHNAKIAVKYQRSGLSEVQARQILNLLDQVMDDKRPYLCASLNLESLAKELSVQPDYLSQALNQFRKTNFYELVASYRVEAAKTAILENPEASMLEVSDSVGFQAKSSFNRTFKRFCGITPTEYRRRHTNRSGSEASEKTI